MKSAGSIGSTSIGPDGSGISQGWSFIQGHLAEVDDKLSSGSECFREVDVSSEEPDIVLEKAGIFLLNLGYMWANNPVILDDPAVPNNSAVPNNPAVPEGPAVPKDPEGII